MHLGVVGDSQGAVELDRDVANLKAAECRDGSALAVFGGLWSRQSSLETVVVLEESGVPVLDSTEEVLPRETVREEGRTFQ